MATGMVSIALSLDGQQIQVVAAAGSELIPGRRFTDAISPGVGHRATYLMDNRTGG